MRAGTTIMFVRAGQLFDTSKNVVLRQLFHLRGLSHLELFERSNAQLFRLQLLFL